MENKLIIEEIERLKLLSGYKPKMTLTENEEIMEYGLSSIESALIKDLKFGLSAEGKALRNKMEDALSSIQHSFTINGVKSNRHTIQDILMAAEKGLLKPEEIGNLYSHTMKTLSKDASVEARRIKDSIISDFVQKPSFVKKYAIKTEEEAIQALLSTGNYTREDAERVIQKYKETGGRFKNGGEIKPIVTKPIITSPIVTLPIPEPWWIELWRNKTFKNAMLVAAGAGGAALLYWWLTSGKDDEKVEWIPFCLKIVHPNGSGGFTQNDLMKMAEKGSVDSLPMASAGVTDSSGNSTAIPNAVFHKDGTFESPMGSGTWLERSGNIQINAGGNVYIIDCSDKTPPPVPTPVPVPVKTDECNGNYTSSTTFPFRMCQQSKEIGEVQKCLGITPDTKFGLQTKNALGKGYLTRTEYDSIMKDCQGGGTGSPERNRTGGTDL